MFCTEALKGIMLKHQATVLVRRAYVAGYDLSQGAKKEGKADLEDIENMERLTADALSLLCHLRGRTDKRVIEEPQNRLKLMLENIHGLFLQTEGRLHIIRFVA